MGDGSPEFGTQLRDWMGSNGLAPPGAKPGGKFTQHASDCVAWDTTAHGLKTVRGKLVRALASRKPECRAQLDCLYVATFPPDAALDAVWGPAAHRAAVPIPLPRLSATPAEIREAMDGLFEGSGAADVS
jgi:hypothetical protein